MPSFAQPPIIERRRVIPASFCSFSSALLRIVPPCLRLALFHPTNADRYHLLLHLSTVLIAVPPIVLSPHICASTDQAEESAFANGPLRYEFAEVQRYQECPLPGARPVPLERVLMIQKQTLLNTVHLCNTHLSCRKESIIFDSLRSHIHIPAVLLPIGGKVIKNASSLHPEGHLQLLVNPATFLIASMEQRMATPRI